MMDTLADKLPEIVKWVESNPLIVTLTSGGAVVWLFANLKSFWHSLMSTLKALVSFEMTNIYEDVRGIGCRLSDKQLAFNKLLASSKALWERTVNVDLLSKETRYGNQNDGIAVVGKIGNIVDAYGFSVRWMLGKLVVVNRSYTKDAQKIMVNSTVRVFFANKAKFLKKIEDEVNNIINFSQRELALRASIAVYNTDTYYGTKLKRNLDSIFTKDNCHLSLFEDISRFINNKDTYTKLNYPYNFCGLLYGVPGSGKTSTILAIASKLNRDVYYINMASISLAQILKAINGTDVSKTIYVFEDIDAVSYRNVESRENNDDKDNSGETSISKAFGLSLSDLLNITDGLLASDGTICLFTTNHIEKLDPAFLRAGRMNKIVEFTYMDSNTAKKMVQSYLSVSLNNLADNIKPAELQDIILKVLLKECTIDDLKQKFCI